MATITRNTQEFNLKSCTLKKVSIAFSNYGQNLPFSDSSQIHRYVVLLSLHDLSKYWYIGTIDTSKVLLDAVVSISDRNSGDPGSIPGRRKTFSVTS